MSTYIFIFAFTLLLHSYNTQSIKTIGRINLSQFRQITDNESNGNRQVDDRNFGTNMSNGVVFKKGERDIPIVWVIPRRGRLQFTCTDKRSLVL
jgi:hypothetical protein